MRRSYKNNNDTFLFFSFSLHKILQKSTFATSCKQKEGENFQKLSFIKKKIKNYKFPPSILHKNNNINLMHTQKIAKQFKAEKCSTKKKHSQKNI